MYTTIREIAELSNKKVSEPFFVENLISLLSIICQQSEDQLLERSEQSQMKALPLHMIKEIFKVCSGNLDGMYGLIQSLTGCDDTKINVLKKLISETQVLINQAKAIKVPDAAEIAHSKFKEELEEKIKEGKLTTEDMFKMIDEDGSGKVSKQEFAGFCNRMGMSLTEHRITEIFANVKKQSKNPQAKDDSELNMEEFTLAHNYVQSKNTNQALDQIGMSLPKLSGKLMVLAFILLLIFVFIFFGIAAFSEGGSFGAVINSVMPMCKKIEIIYMLYIYDILGYFILCFINCRIFHT